jgi:hypothetical protein
MGNAEVEIDAVDSPVTVCDCVFDVKIPRVATVQNNGVLGLAGSLDLAGENVGCRRLEVSGGCAMAIAAENSTKSQPATTAQEVVIGDDDDLEEFVGMCSCV